MANPHQDSEASLATLAKVWPLASEVIRALNKESETTPDLTPSLTEECFEAWRANKPFEEWPEALQRIVQNVAAQTSLPVKLPISRREALEEIIKKMALGSAIVAGGHTILSGNVAALLAQYDVFERLMQSAEKIGKALQVSKNPHAEQIKEKLNQGIDAIRPRDRTNNTDNWRVLLAFVMDVMGGFVVKPYGGSVVGNVLSSKKSQENPANMPAVFEQIESTARIFCALNAVEKTAATNDTSTQTEEDKTFAEDIRTIATSHPGAAIFLTILMKEVPDPAMRAQCLDYLKHSKPKFSTGHVGVNLIAEKAGDIWKKSQMSYVRTMRDAGLLTVAGFSDLLITLPKYMTSVESQAIDTLTDLEKTLDKLKTGKKPPVDKGQWDPVYEAIAQEKKIHDAERGRYEEINQVLNPGDKTKYVLTGIEGLSGHSFGRRYRLGKYPREDAKRIIEAAEAWVQLEAGQQQGQSV